MEFYADLHTHILPGVDDGAADLTTAMQMLSQAYADGTRVLCLTPHFREPYRDNFTDKLLPIFESLVVAAAEKYPDLVILPGCEVHYQSDAAKLLSEGQLLTVGAEHVLLELGWTVSYSMLTAALDDMLQYGFVPIIAHPERYDIFRRDKDLARQVVDMGALLQLNAGSVTGELGFGIKRCCHRLLKEGLASIVASDAHGTQRRTAQLRRCAEYIAKKYSPDYAAQLLWETPRAVLGIKE